MTVLLGGWRALTLVQTVPIRVGSLVPGWHSDPGDLG